MLRSPVFITKSTAAHVGLCVFDLALRFVWALSVFGGVPGRGAGMFFFEVVEIVRRTVWAIFRIEWEVVSKVTYAYSALPNSTPKPISGLVGDDDDSDEEV